MLESVARDCGFKTIRLRKSRKIKGLLALAKLPRNSVILVVYPSLFHVAVGNDPLMGGTFRSFSKRIIRDIEYRILKRVLKTHRSIVYIYDNPIEQLMSIYPGLKIDEEVSRRLEKKFLELFDIFLVFGEAHERTLKGHYGLTGKKFVYYEFSELLLKKVLQKKKEGMGSSIGFVSAIVVDNKWISILTKNCDLKLYVYGRTKNARNANGDNLKYMGVLDQEELVRSLNENCGLGLIQYPPNLEEYISMSATSKFSTYMLAGIPVLYCSRYEHLSLLNKKYHFGIGFDNLNDIPKILRELNPEEYGLMASNCFKLGSRISKGEFTKNALQLALDIRGV